MDRLTDRPDMTLDVYHGRKTTTQQQIDGRRKYVVLINYLPRIDICLPLLCDVTSHIEADRFSINV